MSRDIKYIGMDVHKEAIVIAVLNGSGQLVMESIVETKDSSILQFIHGLRGELHVTWEEGTSAAWLHDLLQPHAHQVLVCNPRRKALLKEGSKNDNVDARRRSRFSQLGTQIRGKSSFSRSLRMCRASSRSVFCLRPRFARITSASPLHSSTPNPSSNRSNQRPCPLASMPTRTA
jgi:transposase